MVRSRDMRIDLAEDRRAMHRRNRRAIAELGRRLIDAVRRVRMPVLPVLEPDAQERGDDHFAETMLGGVAITFGLLVTILVILWLGPVLSAVAGAAGAGTWMHFRSRRR